MTASVPPHKAAAIPATLDTTRIDDTRIKAVRPLITPALLQEWLPATAQALELVETSRRAIANILHGQDDRLIVVVGPCSIHDHEQAMDYARQLQAQAQALQGELLIVMRVYFEKPRTTVGWKGYINDPHRDDSFAMNEGLEMARRLLLEEGGFLYDSDVYDDDLPRLRAHLMVEILKCHPPFRAPLELPLVRLPLFRRTV